MADVVATAAAPGCCCCYGGRDSGGGGIAIVLAAAAALCVRGRHRRRRRQQQEADVSLELLLDCLEMGQFLLVNVAMLGLFVGQDEFINHGVGLTRLFQNLETDLLRDLVRCSTSTRSSSIGCFRTTTCRLLLNQIGILFPHLLITHTGTIKRSVFAPLSISVK